MRLEKPVRLFGQEREVDRVGEASVENFDRDRLGVSISVCFWFSWTLGGRARLS
jgi:hypothetical protein